MASAPRTSGLDDVARAGGRTGRSPDVRGASRRFDEALTAARREARCAPEASGGRPRAPAEHHRGGGFPGGAPAGNARAHRAAAAPAAAVLAGAFSPTCGEVAPMPAPAVLRAAVRGLPPVIEAARLQDGARLALTLGGALAVDLRGGAAGVEVTLRPAAALDHAAAAELPALVAALRAHGVRVARAGVATGARRSPGTPDRQAR